MMIEMGHLCQTILTFFVQNGVSHIGIFLFHCITKNLTVHPSTEFVFNWDKFEGNTYFFVDCWENSKNDGKICFLRCF